MKQEQYNYYSGQLIQSSYRVHKELGPGLLESVYQICLFQELTNRGIKVQQEVFLPITYQGVILDKSFRLDLLLENEIIIEIKAVDSILPVHEAQLLSYLKLSEKWLGFLLNFNVPVMKDGIKRMVNGYL